MGIEENIKKSFESVKKDMAELREQINILTERVEKLESAGQETITLSKSPESELVQLTTAKKPKKTLKKKKN